MAWAKVWTRLWGRHPGGDEATMRRVVLGLGNPGSQYAKTRHNVGFCVADELARRHGICLSERRNRSRLGEGHIGEVPVVIAKPQTFMNDSGSAAVSLVHRYRITPEALVVIADDVNLELGVVRVRASGSAGGHNGLKSIIASLGTEAFPRVRVGVGSPKQGALIDHVLGEFSEEEHAAIAQAVQQAADAVEVLLREGPEAAACRFNRKSRSP
ncbi:MAG: aminoacyl-tRNA hydrolase [Armatimonadota bacterium]|nr:aminoacyl-tRNA hydrolase [Armatimonadota bacterium]